MTSTTTGLAEAVRITTDRIGQAILQCDGHSHRQPAHWVLTDEEGHELMGGYMTEVVEARAVMDSAVQCTICGKPMSQSMADLGEHRHPHCMHEPACSGEPATEEYAQPIPGFDDARALAWYRATYDDDTGDDMVLARLHAWARRQSLGPNIHEVPLREGVSYTAPPF